MLFENHSIEFIYLKNTTRMEKIIYSFECKIQDV